MSLGNLNILFILILGFLFSASLSAQSKGAEKEKSGNEAHEQDLQNHKVLEEKPWNEVCPVRGGKVNTKVAPVEYNEKLYGFCCGGCDTKFEKEPAKYSKNLSADGKKFVAKKS